MCFKALAGMQVDHGSVGAKLLGAKVGAGMGAGALLGDPLAGVNIVSEVFPLHPTRERGRVE